MRQKEKQAWFGVLLMTLALLGLMLVLGGGTGCAGWQGTSTKVARAAEAGVKGSHSFLSGGPCSRAKVASVGKACEEKGDTKCTYLANCEIAMKAEVATLAAVWSLKLAILSGSEATTNESLAALLVRLARMRKSMEVWRD